jgi:hypothetical protein
MVGLFLLLIYGYMSRLPSTERGEMKAEQNSNLSAYYQADRAEHSEKLFLVCGIWWSKIIFLNITHFFNTKKI